MSDEGRMWEVLRPEMVKLKLDPVRVENRAMPGTPDVNYREGWAELKNAERWPPRGGGLHLPHPPTPEQRTWLMKRQKAGGRAHLVLRIGLEWLIFDGVTAFLLWKHGEPPPTQETLRSRALLTCSQPKNVARFLAGHFDYGRKHK